MLSVKTHWLDEPPIQDITKLALLSLMLSFHLDWTEVVSVEVNPTNSIASAGRACDVNSMKLKIMRDIG